MKSRTKIGIGITAGVAVALRPLRRRGRSGAAWTARHFRDLQGRARGERYRLSGHHPDPAVSDDILADRVRSELGPVTKRLDLPHVHVMVENHVVTLHGDVATADDAYVLEEAAAATSGVQGVISLLHEGLLSSDTRPSKGAEQHSPAFRSLLAAAQEAGCRENAARPTVRLVLAGFFEQLPERDRAHLSAHIPVDVKHLTLPPKRTGLAPSRLPDSLDTFVETVAKVDSLSPEQAHEVVVAVLHTLRELLPEEARDVEGDLPLELGISGMPSPASAARQPRTDERAHRQRVRAPARCPGENGEVMIPTTAARIPAATRRRRCRWRGCSMTGSQRRPDSEAFRFPTEMAGDR